MKIRRIQKEFGLVNKVRRDLSASILKSIRKDKAKRKELTNKLKESSRNSEKQSELMKFLGNEAKKEEAVIIKGRKNSRLGINRDYTIDSNRFSPKEIRSLTESTSEERRLGKALTKGKHLIVQKSGATEFAHEIGHVQNKKNLTSRIVSKLNDYLIPKYKKHKDESKGLIGSIKNYANGGLLVQEEKNASKNAMKLLKKSGKINNRQLKEARSVYDDAINSYRLGRDISAKTPLYKSLKVDKNNK